MGIIFIAVGIVLFLNNFGVLPWSVWLTLVDYWPVFFIAIGLELLAGKNFYFRLVVQILILTGLAFLVIQVSMVQSAEFRKFMKRSYPWMPYLEEMFKPRRSLPDLKYRFNPGGFL